METIPRHLRVGLLLAAIVGLSGLVASPSEAAGSATQVSASDPDDVGSRLDIVHEKFRKRDGVARLTIRTAERWRCPYLNDLGSSEGDTSSAALIWDFDTDADGHFGDMVGDFYCEDGRLHFQLHDPQGEYKTKLYRSRRPTRRTAVVRVPVKALHAKHLALRATSRVTGITDEGIFFEEDDLAPTLKAY